MAEQVMRLATGFWHTKALSAAAELDVADIIHKLGGSANTEEIVAHAQGNTDPGSLFRVLRSLASLGVFDMQLHGSPDDTAYHRTYKFSLTDAGQALRSDVPNSMRNSVLLETGHLHYLVWGGFTQAARTGKCQVEAMAGTKDVWEYGLKHPDHMKIMNGAMSNMSAIKMDTALSTYDFSNMSTIADVGGGLGRLLFGLLQKYPNIKKGHLFDQPEVVRDAVVPDDLRHRTEIHGGNFLAKGNTGIPRGADAYVLKHIIHDWDDENSEVILKAVKKAMPQHGKLFLVEYVVPLTPQPCFAKFMDLHMMVVCGSKERTKAEYAALLNKAGFKLVAVHGNEGDMNYIEAHPI